MKKLLFLLITLAYMVSATGATLYVHHCMGEVVDWDFKKTEADTCHTCGMHKNDPNDCCRDEIKVLKLDKAQKQPEAARHDIGIKNILLPLTFFVLVKPAGEVSLHSYPSENFFPKDVISDLCILHCTFLI